MGMRLNYITPLLVASAAAAAIAAAPTAFAADQQFCNGSVSATICQSPSSVPLKTPVPDVQHQSRGNTFHLSVQDLALALSLVT
jgi:hypothetical protein